MVGGSHFSKNKHKFQGIGCALLLFSFFAPSFIAPPIAYASDITAQEAVEIFPAVQSGSFVEGSTFEVPILLNTRGLDINTVTLTINFDPNKLSIVAPSGGKSIVGLWFEPPSYDNVRGTENLGGIITNGINTNAGLITTITFKARTSGEAIVSIGANSRVLLNDGLGTDATVRTIRGVYTLLPSPPGAVSVYSETHPLQDKWYNNDSPILTWDKDPDVTRFAISIDDKPHTIPDDSETTTDTQKAFEHLTDGIWYFHIKAEKKGVWGSTANFKIQIDTIAPADFKPNVNYLTAGNNRQAHVSFLTTDSLSGIDYYEVGTQDLSEGHQGSPVFIQAVSPYQIQLGERKRQRVIVRVFDQAGNARDAEVMVREPLSIITLLKTNISALLAVLLFGLLTVALFHYIYGHRIVARLKAAYRVLKSPGP